MSKNGKSRFTINQEAAARPDFHRRSPFNLDEIEEFCKFKLIQNVAAKAVRDISLQISLGR